MINDEYKVCTQTLGKPGIDIFTQLLQQYWENKYGPDWGDTESQFEDLDDFCQITFNASHFTVIQYKRNESPKHYVVFNNEKYYNMFLLKFQS